MSQYCKFSTAVDGFQSYVSSIVAPSNEYKYFDVQLKKCVSPNTYFTNNFSPLTEIMPIIEHAYADTDEDEVEETSSLTWKDSQTISNHPIASKRRGRPPKISSKSETFCSKVKNKKTLSDHATNILTQWIVSHQQNPYPTQQEKEYLANRTNLTVKQVVDWMTNMRKRKLYPLLSGTRKPKRALDFIFLANSTSLEQSDLTNHSNSNASDDSDDSDESTEF